MKAVTSTFFASFLFKACMAHPARAVDVDFILPRNAPLHAREKGTDCGEGYGSCAPGSCCSESNWCGTTEDYCDGSSCQLDYSDSCDTFSRPSGSSTESIARPKIGSVPYGSIITGCTESGTLALAFDDGPYTWTSEIMDVLDEYDVKGTFFITGNNLGKGHIDDSSLAWPDLLQRMYSAGHQLASHTWTHRDQDTINSTIQNTEMIYNEMAFRNLFGWFPTYMRPPYLDCSSSTGCLSTMGDLGYHIITTNLDTKDYENDSPDLIQASKDRFSAGLSDTPSGNGYIILAHDVHEQTVTNLTAYMITTAQDRGYKIVTVGACLGDPEENWYRSATDTECTSTAGCTSTAAQTSTSTTKVKTSSTSTGTSSSATASSGVTISPNQECGGSTGYTCKGSAFGNCCSYYGYCGSTDTYCGTGCDVDFGECNSSSGNITDTTNGLCGATYKTTCANYGTKTCCSQYGYCGSAAANCGTGCQSDYGTCT
ncbi:hypothetical protein G7Z17_g6784 [Cylindrodendrum hubeiense]|uniref:Chitin deacetylase n=1 Tax=Cylindrodendrum hubeiense TaxID=595255 RepID=A0A9P5LAH8_9HYPO|nr:hypothetical protein G7Z17_g6784 [Cylindrodendrum hubeiense]